MSDVEQPDVVIVGAGLAGALLATYLGKAGFRVDLYERRPDQRVVGAFGGRSINLALSVRGIHALEEVGVAERVMASAIPMRGRMIHSPTGRLAFQPYDKDPSRCINSVSRAGLNVALLDAAERCPGVRIRFDARCVDADLERPAAVLSVGPGREPRTACGRVLIGADGAYSAVRAAMQRLERFDYRQDYLAHGYKELHIPPAAGGRHAMEPHALHVWPRRSFMMIGLPNADGSFTCTLFWPFEGPSSFERVRTDDDVRRFFEREFPDALPLMPTLTHDFRRNPVGSMVTIRCGPWYDGGKVVLVGDAAHAVVPFYGQGMNAAFEDCTVLCDCLRRHAEDPRAAFEAYYRLRKPHTDALAELAIGNFLEMRDRSASRLFRMKKLGERTLHRLLPGWYTPLYTLVSFTRVPYADAVRRATRQNRVVALVGAALVGLLGLAIAAACFARGGA